MSLKASLFEWFSKRGLLEMKKIAQEKIPFSGMIRSIQPRSSVWRYRLDNRNHTLKGYNLFIHGLAEGEEKDFSVAISEKQQMKYLFHIGDEISGSAWTKIHPELEYADYYRAGALKKVSAGSIEDAQCEPWTGEVPALEVYSERGCRMLDTRCWSGKCFTCKWACKASVAIEYIFGVRQIFRYESFCYGPKNCPLYRMGAPRKVPDQTLGFVYDDGALDRMFTSHRTDEE